MGHPPRTPHPPSSRWSCHAASKQERQVDSALYAIHPSFPDRFLRAQGCGSVGVGWGAAPTLGVWQHLQPYCKLFLWQQQPVSVAGWREDEQLPPVGHPSQRRGSDSRWPCLVAPCGGQGASVGELRRSTCRGGGGEGR